MRARPRKERPEPPTAGRRSGMRPTWIARLSTASAASFTASVSVGWAWQVRAMSSAERAELHRHGGLGDHLAGVGADDVHAEHAVGLGVGEHLHEAVRRAG